MAPYGFIRTMAKRRFQGSNEGPLLVLHGSLWVYTHYCCHQMITQRRLKGPRGLSEGTQQSQFVSEPVPTSKPLSSLLGPHRKIGLRNLEIEPGRQPLFGVFGEKEKETLRLDRCTATARGQLSFPLHANRPKVGLTGAYMGPSSKLGERA